jgi:hypothetical protein
MKKEGYKRKTTFEKKKKKTGFARVIGRPGLAGSLHGLFFDKPGSIQPPDSRSTYQASLDLITMVVTLS